MDPAQRRWAHAYLAYVARHYRVPYDGARESMQLLARYFDMELAEPVGRLTRSGPALDLANRIRAQTGVEIR